jgi:hypothetical protein
MNTPIIITVQPSTSKRGYELRHNQYPGWKGIIGMSWGWYKYRTDAQQRADELMKQYNCL